MTSPASKTALRGATLTLTVALEVIFFPGIAAALIHAAGSRGGVGSEITTFRDLYVVPSAVLFVVASWAILALAGQRRFVLMAVWIANACTLIVAICVYRAMVSRWD